MIILVLIANSMLTTELITFTGNVAKSLVTKEPQIIAIYYYYYYHHHHYRDIILSNNCR
jgi:hypothetical protein